MDLTPNQETLLKEYTQQLNDYIWDNEYYGENPNPILTQLFQEGVEVNFEVKVIPYVGIDHPEYEDR